MSWSEIARAAAIFLVTGDERQDDSEAAELLRDLHEIFSAHDALKTSDLLGELHKVEDSPWGDWRGKPLTGHGLARLLRPYRIKTMTVWANGESVRGYKADQFADAFARYLGAQAAGSGRTGRTRIVPSFLLPVPAIPAASDAEPGEADASTRACPQTLRSGRKRQGKPASHAGPAAPAAPAISHAKSGENGRPLPAWTCPKCGRAQPLPELKAGLAYCACGGHEAIGVSAWDDEIPF
jgi:hypothetical protein